MTPELAAVSSIVAASSVLPKVFIFRRRILPFLTTRERWILRGATPSVAALFCWLR